MNAERWRQVKAIFHGAVESDPAAALSSFESCGDDHELLREVESLLASEQDPGHLLENPLISAGAMAAAAPPSRTDPHSHQPCTLLPERYEILGELGRGGMGIVYKARDRETGEVMALKILKPEIAADLGIIERFKNELLLAHRITHHNVARLFEFHRAGDTLYLSMEYVEGESLRALLLRTGKLDVPRGLDIARQIAAGVAEAHRQSIAHRDLKPDNIMLTPGGEVKVLDFGISRYYAANTTATGGFIGTPAYMAPEQAEGKPTDHRTDIYALGLILYEMFTGTKAFSGVTPVSLALKQVREKPRPRKHLPPTCRYTSNRRFSNAWKRIPPTASNRSKTSCASSQSARAVCERPQRCAAGWCLPARAAMALIAGLEPFGSYRLLRAPDPPGTHPRSWCCRLRT